MSQINDSIRQNSPGLSQSKPSETAKSREIVEQSKILIGYSMRSGSTLLQHILDQHSGIQSHSDVSSYAALLRVLLGAPFSKNICVKPMDLLFLRKKIPFMNKFDKRIWITRDPRDSYLSALESGYAYLFWPQGKKSHDIDVGLLHRWRRVHRHYLDNKDKWHFIRYEDLVDDPDTTLGNLFEYLELEYEELLPFDKFKFVNGGDWKILKTNTVEKKSLRRYERELTTRQQKVIQSFLHKEMKILGYE
jgi:hypothetical protein